ncbi:MAG: ABC transporter permease, partial [Alcaligenaceae bacterium]
NYANFALAAALSMALGLVTWLVMYVARRYTDSAPVSV